MDYWNYRLHFEIAFHGSKSLIIVVPSFIMLFKVKGSWDMLLEELSQFFVRSVPLGLFHSERSSSSSLFRVTSIQKMGFHSLLLRMLLPPVPQSRCLLH